MLGKLHEPMDDEILQHYALLWRIKKKLRVEKETDKNITACKNKTIQNWIRNT